MNDKQRHPTLERLLEGAANKGYVGPAALANALNESDQVVTNWARRGVSRGGAVKAEKLLGISSLWVLTGDRHESRAPLGSDDEQSALRSTPSPHNERTDVVIRQFDTGGSMGSGILLAEQPGVIKEWRVSDRWAQENVHRITAVRNLAIVTGFGPSMQPLFNPGDPLLVDTGIKRADVDGIYFFRVGQEGFVKQLQRIPTTHGLILRAKSYNTLYDPFDITEGMDFQVFARVVKVWKGEEF